jgi:hypothetical protein
VLGTCVDFIPAYLYHCRTFAQDERIKVVKGRVRGYKREFGRFSGAYCLTSTHGMLVFV